jgi:hypothetical protein
MKKVMRRISGGLARSSMKLLGFVAERVVPIVIGIIVVGGGTAVFASLDSPAAPTAPAAQSYTLGDICSRLATGATGVLASTFDEPPSGVSDTMCSLTELLATAPAVDDATCAGVGDVLSGNTYWGLCSGGGWGLLTGTATSLGAISPVAATGQNVCYDASGNVISCTGTGQDGDYQLGDTTSPRFTDNADGTVTDNLMGLIWLKNANCYGTRNWTTALTDANGLASGSCSLSDGSVAGDWRLPNIRELASLIDYQTDPAPRIPTGHPFTSVVSSLYWSSSSYSTSLANAWSVSFSTGNVNGNNKAAGIYVWPVR